MTEAVMGMLERLRGLVASLDLSRFPVGLEDSVRSTPMRGWWRVRLAPFLSTVCPLRISCHTSSTRAFSCVSGLCLSSPACLETTLVVVVTPRCRTVGAAPGIVWRRGSGSRRLRIRHVRFDRDGPAVRDEHDQPASTGVLPT